MQYRFACARAAVPWLVASACCSAIAGEPARETQLEEVVVTGTLRAQAVQEVPGSVTLLDTAALTEAGQQHFQDVLALVPNLHWAAGTSRPRYFQIRGIGEREQYEGAPNPSVGFIIDDIDFSGVGMPATLFDVGQIEVLRGPQGTRYGANALAGLIVVRGQDPQREPGLALQATGGNYGTRAAGLAATGPLSVLDSAWRLSVQQYQSDGFLTNSTLGRDDTNDRDELTARLKWRSWLHGAGTLDLTLLHADIDNGYDAWSLDGTRETASDMPGTDRQRATAGSARFERGLRGNQFTAIAGFARSKSRYGYDYDWGGPAYWDPYVYEGVDNWDRIRRTASAELRLASAAPDDGNAVAWLAGAHALRLEEEGRYTSEGRYVDPVDAGWDWTDSRRIDDDYAATNLAVFGQLDGRWSSAWRWSLGLRLEQRRAEYQDAGQVNGEPQVSDLRARNRMVGGSASLSRVISARTTAYLLASRGYKAGGFNLGTVDDTLRRFGPEYLWNYETGIKSTFGDGRGQAELSVFHQQRRDQQVRSGRQLVGGGPYEFVTINLPSGYSRGLEASLRYALRPSLEIGGSLGLLRSRSGAATNADGEPIASREAAHAPSYTAAAHATWRSAQGFFARVDVTAMDDFYFDVPTDHDQRAEGHALAHLKIGLERAGWSVHAWLRNAFNEQYAVRGFYFGNDPRAGWDTRLYQQYGDPRQFGVTASLDF